MRSKKAWLVITIIALLLFVASVGCSSQTNSTTETAAEVATTEAAPAENTETSTEGAVKIGLSFSDFATERWKNEEVLMRQLLEAKGYEVLSQEANHDVKLQIDQIDNMVSQGVKGLIIIAEDGDALSTAV
ncbi:MAG: substrate-binding domain-containing protein, partial [Anaerolineales bacterium]|nr:substrate-binding domain-containing protein [Anaerolineales bacterium]